MNKMIAAVGLVFGMASAANAQCGDANYNGTVSVIDARAILSSVVFETPCPVHRCDLDGSLDVTITDALRALRYIVGTETELACTTQFEIYLNPNVDGPHLSVQVLVEYTGTMGECAVIDPGKLDPDAGTGGFSTYTREADCATKATYNGGCEGVYMGAAAITLGPGFDLSKPVAVCSYDGEIDTLRPFFIEITSDGVNHDDASTVIVLSE
jgi:hypothetical protein